MAKPVPSFFIDYPDIDGVAEGDLLCFQGEWRKVTDIVYSCSSITNRCRADQVNHIVTENSDLWAHPNFFPGIPRIAAPLLDALKSKDPYR